MPRIPDEWIERLKHEVLVEDLARRAGVELRTAGQELVGRCPFPPHEDHTPSLSINVAKNCFQCFGCGVAGTCIDWVKHERGVEFREAVEWLLWEFFPSAAQELLGERRREGQQTRRSRAPELPCPFDLSAAEEQTTLSEYVDHCAVLFRERAEPQEYVSKRGLESAEMAAHFRFGYQDRSLGLMLPTGDTKAARQIRERFKKLGLLRESGHAHFVGSLVIPTIDLSGNVTGIYGRKTRDDLNGKSSPKHLYLPGKDDDVFNEEAFVASKEIVLCESRIDALSFWRHDIRNVTACRGAGNFSQALFEAFVRYGAERCFIAFDHDEAGDKGALKAAEKLMAVGIGCFRVRFPRGMDANEVSRVQTPARKHLDLYLRSAEWMGNGSSARSARAGHGQPPRDGAPLGQAPAAVSPAHVAPSSAAEAAQPAAPPTPAEEATSGPSEATEEDDGGATEEGISVKPAPKAAPASPVDRFAQAETASDAIAPSTEALGRAPQASAPDIEASARAAAPAPPVAGGELNGEDEAVFRFEDRRYRVQGLKKALTRGSLHVVVHAERDGDFFAPPSPISGSFLDRFDFVSALARQRFEKNAAHEMAVAPELVKWDLGQVLRRLEELQRAAIEEALKPKVLVPTMSDAQRAEALEYASAPDLIERHLADYEKTGVVGEKTNKLVGSLGSVSRLSRRPLAIVIRSSSAAGKTALMDAVLRFIPKEAKEKYSAVSGHALFYFEGKDFKHKVLAIVEEEGASRAMYPLKLLQSEGEITIASTGKDPGTGRLVTKEYRVEGPVMIFLASTSVDIDDELLNRAIVLTVDEGREQTRRIHELQRESQALEGLWAEEEREEIYHRHHNLQRLLRPLHVVNPYVRELTFLDDRTRTRRDHTKYLGLIEASALLHQYQRPIKGQTRGGKTKEYVEVDLFDVALANRLASEVLGRSLDELGPQTRRFLMLLDEMVTAACEEHAISRFDFRFSRRDIRDATAWSDTQVRVHLDRLVSLEYVFAHRGGRGQTFVYELLYDGQGKDGTPFLIGLADVEALARAHGLPVPRQVLEPLVRPQVKPKDTATTRTSRGFQGTSRGHRGAIAPLPRGGRGVEESAQGTAPGPISPQTRENAHGGSAPKTYTQGGRSDRSAGVQDGSVRLRLNLLRFPPQPKTSTTDGNGSKPHASLFLKRAPAFRPQDPRTTRS